MVEARDIVALPGMAGDLGTGVVLALVVGGLFIVDAESSRDSPRGRDDRPAGSCSQVRSRPCQGDQVGSAPDCHGNRSGRATGRSGRAIECRCLQVRAVARCTGVGAAAKGICCSRPSGQGPCVATSKGHGVEVFLEQQLSQRMEILDSTDRGSRGCCPEAEGRRGLLMKELHSPTSVVAGYVGV